MKLSRCFTLLRKHNFQGSTRISSKSATSVVEHSFVMYPDAGFRLIFFRKDLLNYLPHQLTSESLFMVDFCCQLFSWKTEKIDCNTGNAIHVVES